jgi:hypothetical protein
MSILGADKKATPRHSLSGRDYVPPAPALRHTARVNERAVSLDGHRQRPETVSAEEEARRLRQSRMARCWW